MSIQQFDDEMFFAHGKTSVPFYVISNELGKVAIYWL